MSIEMKSIVITMMSREPKVWPISCLKSNIKTMKSTPKRNKPTESFAPLGNGFSNSSLLVMETKPSFMRCWKIGSLARSTPWNEEINEATAAPNKPAGKITINASPKETPIFSTTTYIAAVAAEMGEAEMAI